MKDRDANTTTVLRAGALTDRNTASANGKPAKKFPQVPRAGDTLGIIAPASQIKKEHLDAAVASLQKLGFKTFHFDAFPLSAYLFPSTASRAPPSAPA